MSMNISPDGNVFTFTNRQRGGVITLKAGVGETLLIDGSATVAAGSDTQVQFNTAGDFDATSGLVFDKTTNTLSTDYVTGQLYSDDTGRNELSNLQSLQHTNTAVARSQGTSVSITQTGPNWIAAGAPFYPSFGAEVLFSASSGGGQIFSQYATALVAGTITAGTTGLYSDINEDGSRLVLSNGSSTVPTLTFYKNTAGTWSADTPFTQGSLIFAKLSGDYMIAGSATNFVGIYNHANPWSLQKTVVATGGSNTYSVCDIINEDTAVVNVGGDIYVLTRVSTTWTQIQTISTGGANILAINLFNNLLVFCSSTQVYIYSRASSDPSSTYSLVDTISDTNIQDICTNGTYIFYIRNTRIKIYSLVSGTWTKSENNTIIDSDTFKIACNANYLVVGSPNQATYGQVKVYDINAYTNQLLNVNTISLNQDYPNLKISSLDGDVIVDDTMLVTGAVTLSDTLTASGNVNATNITATQNMSCVNLTASGNLNATSGYVNVKAGTVSAPGVLFGAATTTGIWSDSTTEIDFAVSGTNRFAVRNADNTSSQVMHNVNGSSTAPAYAFSNATNTGLYYNGTDAVGLTVGGGTGLYQFYTGGVVFNKYLALPNGLVSSPALKFNNATTTGIYYSTDELNFASAGTRILALWQNASRPSNRYDAYFLRPNAVSVNSTVTLGVQSDTLRVGIEIVAPNSGVTPQSFMSFCNNAGEVGSITNAGTVTAFNTTSDARIKENFKNLNSGEALNLVKSINIRKFNYVDDENKQVYIGTTAQELCQVYPVACNMAGMSDADLILYNEEQKEGDTEEILSRKKLKSHRKFHSVDYMKLIPVLIKAVQDLSAEVEILKSKMLS